MCIRDSARGVRVVPEIDVPAHTRAWGAAFPEILVACPRHAATRENPSDVPALDPSAARTYAVVDAVVRHVARIFPDEFMHLGADEVRTECWLEDATLMATLARRYPSNKTDRERVHSANQEFESAALESARRAGKRPVVWQGALDAGLVLGRDVVVEPWKCWSGMHTNAARRAADTGHAVLDASCW